MKKNLLICLLTCLIGSSEIFGYSQGWENGGTALVPYRDSCYTFTNTHLQATNVIAGIYTLRTRELTSLSASMSTPFFSMGSSNELSFYHKINNKTSSPVLNVFLDDGLGGLILIYSHTYLNNSVVFGSANTFVTGVYRLIFTWSGSGGTSRGFVDDIAIDAPYVSNPPICSAPPPNPLPIELSSFNCSVSGKSVVAKWVTLSEINNDYFEVERSVDGIHYTSIAVIDGAGNSNIKLHYSFIDINPKKGRNYYRLKQTDFDGHYTTSKTVQVSLASNSAEFTMQPNPSENFFNIHLSSTTESEIEVQVSDMTGKIQFTEMIMYSNERSADAIDISKLSKGIYFVKVVAGDAVYTQRLVKR